jgi:hypothetical protein
MSLLDKSNKNTISSSVEDQILESIGRHSPGLNCTISKGVFHIYKPDMWSCIYLTSDIFKSLMDVKEVRFHDHARVLVVGDIQFDENITIKSQFNIGFENSSVAPGAIIQGLNIECDNFYINRSKFKLKDIIITECGTERGYKYPIKTCL